MCPTIVKIGFLVAPLLVVAGCTSTPQATEATARPDVSIVVGTRYNKGFYQAGGKTVVSFQLAVTNRGSDTGRSADPECYTSVGNRRIELKVFGNPELGPGERGWFRTGIAVPRMSPREAENLEPSCDL